MAYYIENAEFRKKVTEMMEKHVHARLDDPLQEPDSPDMAKYWDIDELRAEVEVRVILLRWTSSRFCLQAHPDPMDRTDPSTRLTINADVEAALDIDHLTSSIGKLYTTSGPYPGPPPEKNPFLPDLCEPCHSDCTLFKWAYPFICPEMRRLVGPPEGYFWRSLIAFDLRQARALRFHDHTGTHGGSNPTGCWKYGTGVCRMCYFRPPSKHPFVGEVVSQIINGAPTAKRLDAITPRAPTRDNEPFWFDNRVLVHGLRRRVSTNDDGDLVLSECNQVRPPSYSFSITITPPPFSIKGRAQLPGRVPVSWKHEFSNEHDLERRRGLYLVLRQVHVQGPLQAEEFPLGHRIRQPQPQQVGIPGTATGKMF